MADSDDPRAQWLSALGTIVAVGAIIGTILGVVTYGAIRVTGLAGEESASHRPSSRSPATAELEAAKPRGGAAAVDSGARSRSKAARAEDRPRAHHKSGQRAHQRHWHRAAHRLRRAHRHRDQHGHRHHHRAHAARHRVTLMATPHRVQRMGRVHLSGRYRGHGGTSLVVQRLEGGRWERFPVSVFVDGGRFRTWIASGHPGPNRFRVVDLRTRRSSSPVTVVVR